MVPHILRMIKTPGIHSNLFPISSLLNSFCCLSAIGSQILCVQGRYMHIYTMKGVFIYQYVGESDVNIYTHTV